MKQNIELKDEKKFSSDPQFSKEEIKQSMDQVIRIIDHNLKKFTDKFPSSASTNLVYDQVENNEWTSSFWTGLLWLAYEYTNDEKYYQVIKIHLKSFKERIYRKAKDVQTHDIGFLYSLSWVPQHRKFHDEESKTVILEAANQLIYRYLPNAKIIQAWGDLNDPQQMGRMIIDCNLNLPLLYYATEISGDPKYKTIAENHVNQALKYVIRDNYSTYHTYYLDVKTGKPLYGKTHQGNSDSSCWARGQAWGIYGFSLNYKYIKDEKLIEAVKNLTNYYLNHLPNDLICNWDLDFIEDNGQRDASAAAIASCGMLELIKYLPDNDCKKHIYKNAANITMKTLSEKYIGDDLNGILLHSVHNMNNNDGVDEYCLYGDYYYFEALMRLYKNWELFW